MNKTAALAIARQHVYMTRLGRGWMVTGPYRVDELDGAVTDSHEMDYWRARAARAEFVVELALYLMGYRDDQILDAGIHSADVHSSNGIMDSALASLAKTGERR